MGPQAYEETGLCGSQTFGHPGVAESSRRAKNGVGGCELHLVQDGREGVFGLSHRESPWLDDCWLGGSCGWE